MTLSPSETAMMEGDRFWAQRFTSFRNVIFPRFVDLVDRTLTAPSPL